jgi:uroporphyrinogen decarboxylase
MKKSGRYIFASDHSIPSGISLEDYKRLVGIIKEVGSYC